MLHTLEPIIREHPFFHELEERHIKIIVGCASSVRVAAGQILLREGDEANQFFLIREGLVAVGISIPPGGSKVLQTVSAGEMLGWSWLFPPHRWHFDALAVEPTRALAFDGKCLRNKCEKDHDLGYEFLKRFSRIVTHRLEATQLQLLDLYGTNA